MNIVVFRSTTSSPSTLSTLVRLHETFHSVHYRLFLSDRMLVGESGVSHMRGTECDIRVLSNKETTHWIRSPGVGSLLTSM